MKLLSTSNVKLKVSDVLPIENSEDILFYSYNNYLVRYAITQEKEIWRSKIKGEYASLSKGVFLEHFIVFEVIGNIEWLAVDLNTGEVHEFDKLHDSGALVSFSNHFIDFCYDVIDEETGEEKIEDDYYVYGYERIEYKQNKFIISDVSQEYPLKPVFFEGSMTGVLKLNKLYVVSKLDYPTVDIYNIEKELISKIEIQRDLAASSYIDITFSSDEREVTLEVLSSGNRSWGIFEIETGKLLYDKVSVPKEARVQYIDEYTLLVFVSPEGDVSNSEMTLKHSSFYSINLKTGEVELIKTVDEAYFCGESSEGVYLVGGDSRTIEFYSLPHQVPPLHRR